jgi:hypothetical protein
MIPNFIDLCIAGKAQVEQINDFSNIKHREHPTALLHKFLGFSTEDYVFYVSGYLTTEAIINKKLGRPYSWTFVYQCLMGTAQENELGSFIEEWESSNSRLKVHDFLGMNKCEYVNLLNGFTSIHSILNRRHLLRS